MSKADKKADRAARAWRSQRQRLRLECRECEVICERVVSPWHCLLSRCACVYAYEDGETTYFGCLHKVFAPELDLAAFSGEARPGAAREAAELHHGPDPYGCLRAFRTPLPHCRVTIERAYVSSSALSGCCNPTFFHHPASPDDGGIRMITNSFPDRPPGSRN